tara:strand:+ start:1656 stop:2918 length:1263 start_codon:yes stop_codon:yes gene_type:complete
MKNFLKSVNFSVPTDELNEIKKQTKEVVAALGKGIKKNKIKAEVFVGGSFAKGTLAKSDEYDIDIFIRFDRKYEDLSYYLEQVVKKSLKDYKHEKVHGSRNYFKLWKEKKITFEVIPVLKIKKPEEGKNVTDLSYFHVNYVKRGLNKDKIRELQWAKRFFKARGVYGAESYIQGFSGYSLECLIIHYKTFEKLLKALVAVKKGERLIIDQEKRYKKKNEILLELNDSKTHSPIILVDPTWKERNALAALSRESFERFQPVVLKFLKNPSKKDFEVEKISKEKLKKQAKTKKAEFLQIEIKTNRQEGDIAGTKLKKFANFLEREIGKYYLVLRSEFEYDLEKAGKSYLIVKNKKDIVRPGPPIKMKEATKAFKKANKKTFVKAGKLYTKIKMPGKAKVFVNSWKKDNKKVVKDMGIVSLDI